MSLRTKVRKAVRSAGLAEEFGVSEAVLADYLIDSLDSLALVLAARDAGDERSNGPAPLLYRLHGRPTVEPHHCRSCGRLSSPPRADGRCPACGAKN